jgi:nitroreductase
MNNFLLLAMQKVILENITRTNAMTDFNTLIYKRRSIRKFKNKAIESDKIELLLKAALLAPSGKRMYPCEFIIVDDKNTLKAISKSKSHGAALVATAPLAIVVVADTSKYDIWVEDASIASTFIMLQAENMGLGCCWVQLRLRGSDDGISSTENLKTILNLKPEHELLSVLALGYKDDEKPAYSDDDLKIEKIHHNKYSDPNH